MNECGYGVWGEYSDWCSIHDRDPLECVTQNNKALAAELDTLKKEAAAHKCLPPVNLLQRLTELEDQNGRLADDLQGKAFDVIQCRIGDWQRATFPESTEETVLTHLKRELDEFLVSRKPDEAADCLMLFISFAEKRGFCLLDALLDKFEICKKRKWGKPDAQGVREHVREPKSDGGTP